jgi:hypothetical protein
LAEIEQFDGEIFDEEIFDENWLKLRNSVRVSIQEISPSAISPTTYFFDKEKEVFGALVHYSTS